MSPRPGRVFEEIDITLGRPRDRLSDAFEAAKRRVFKSLNESLANPDAPRRESCRGRGIAVVVSCMRVHRPTEATAGAW